MILSTLPNKRVARIGGLALAALTPLALSACGSSSAPPSTASSAAKGSGSLTLLYAGSLVGAIENVIGPAFKSTTGYTLNGTPGGSIGLANEIKSKLVRSDVFISAVPSVNSSLEGSSNGDFVSWYSPLATAPLVIGYNPSSKFAAALKTEPWYKVLAEPGFKLGRTDPVIDPKGALTLKLVQQEAAALNQSKLVSEILGTPENPAQVFPEETLVARLLTGQLDAGFFFSNEAALAKIPTIKTGLSLGANFTVTILNGAPHRAAAEAFVKFLYSKRGQSLMKGVGLKTEAPSVVGNASDVPKGLSSVL